MRNLYFSFVVILILAFSFNSCGPSSDDAAKYNDALVAQQAKVFNAETELTVALLKNRPLSEIDTAFSRLVKQIDLSSDSVKKADNFDNKSDLKDALLELFTTYKTTTEKDYAEVIQLTRITDTTITMAEDYDKKIVLRDKIDSVLNGAVDKFEKIHFDFAKKYRIEFDNKKPEATESKEK